MSSPFEHPYRLAAQLLVTYGLLWGAAQLLGPPLGASFAHGAQSWILATSWAPYLAEISWTEEGYLARDVLLPIGRVIEAPTLPFAFAFPLGLAIALPASSAWAWLLRLSTTLAVSYAVCTALLAILVEETLIESLGAIGVTVHEPPRPALIRAASRYVWDVSEVIFPVGMGVWIGYSAFVQRSAEEVRDEAHDHAADDGAGGDDERSGGSSGDGDGKDDASMGAGHDGAGHGTQSRRAAGKAPVGMAITLVAVLLILGVLETRARRVLEVETRESHETGVRKLAALNAGFGASLIRIGDLYLEYRRPGLAAQMFERAREYPGNELLAQDGIRRARAQAKKKARARGRQQDR